MPLSSNRQSNNLSVCPKKLDQHTYGSEAAARTKRGKATMELTLALGRPELMPQTPVVLQGFKDVIDNTPWLVVKPTHTLSNNGLTTRAEQETRTTSQSH